MAKGARIIELLPLLVLCRGNGATKFVCLWKLCTREFSSAANASMS